MARPLKIETSNFVTIVDMIQFGGEYQNLVQLHRVVEELLISEVNQPLAQVAGRPSRALARGDFVARVLSYCAGVGCFLAAIPPVIMGVARVLSYCAGVGCFLAAIPPVIMGVITINTDWVSANGANLEEGAYKLAVPLCLSKLCPPVVSFIAQVAGRPSRALARGYFVTN
eukprot:sb/3472165/